MYMHIYGESFSCGVVKNLCLCAQQRSIIAANNPDADFSAIGRLTATTHNNKNAAVCQAATSGGYGADKMTLYSPR
jgi:hypothetical protein